MSKKKLVITGGAYGDYTSHDEDETGQAQRWDIREKMGKAISQLGGPAFVLSVSQHSSVSEADALHWCRTMGVQTVVYQLNEYHDDVKARESCAESIAESFPDAVIVFPGGCETLIQKCREAGAKIWRVKG